MNNYVLSAEALQDLDEIYDYLANRSIAAANRFWDAVQQKCQLVASFPNIGKSYEYLTPSLRGFVVDDYLGFAEKVIKSRGWEMNKRPFFLTE